MNRMQVYYYNYAVITTTISFILGRLTLANYKQDPSREKSSTPEQSSSSMLNWGRRMTDSDRERKSYDRRMRSLGKEKLTSVDFREK